MTVPIKIISKKEFLEKHDKPSQEEIWDSISVPWGKYVVKNLPFVEEFLKGKQGNVVDLGCGSGRNMIKGKGLKYWCVDFSANQLEHAKKYAEDEGIDAEVFKMDLKKLDGEVFKDRMFDYGVFIATLHCLESKKARLNALKEFYRILKKGGEGLISVWDAEDKRFDVVGNKGDIYMNWRNEGNEYFRYYYLYSKDELLKLLKDVGFKVLEVYGEDLHDRFSKKNLVVKVGK
ncbi:class I SAM-dependent methyltransferase [archaeon]|jgi:ubiquinone/menaquinone biosynthesis C-methylase UbiE|nr:class I SAM-dependent methyltransferase [archaeon]MBT4241987.1 class I SAM-dependent methyltransferase [archaeon]MBT4418534.1 class I SAM-dependent methyltransferase [archaeon]